MTGRENPPGGSSQSNGKVARLIEKHSLEDIGDEFEAAWTSEAGERRSLRDLAEEFNERLLAATLERNGVDVLPGEPTNLYRLLTDDDVTSGVRTQAVNRLERGGVDVDELLDDFISRQAIHTFLTKDRGASYPDRHGDSSDRRLQDIERLKSRLSAVVKRVITGLTADDEIEIGDPEVLVTVRVRCADCGHQSGIGDLLTNGSCACGTR